MDDIVERLNNAFVPGRIITSEDIARAKTEIVWLRDELKRREHQIRRITEDYIKADDRVNKITEILDRARKDKPGAFRALGLEEALDE